MYIADESTEGSNTNPAEAATTTGNEAPKAPEPTEGKSAEGQDTGGTEETADGKPAEGEAPKDDKPAGAPESYAEFVVPDGYTLEGERLEMAQGMFREAGLTQETAQKFIDAFIKADSENGDARNTLYNEALTQQITQWGNESRAQLGDKFDATVSDAAFAVSLVNDPELVNAFEQLGWGNHPKMLKAFAHFGAMFKEAGMDGTGGGRPHASKSAASVLFDHPTSQQR